MYSTVQSDRASKKYLHEKDVEKKIDIKIFENNSSTDENDEADILSKGDCMSQSDTINQSNQVRESKIRQNPKNTTGKKTVPKLNFSKTFEIDGFSR